MKANATAHSCTPILASKSKSPDPGKRAPRPAKARTQSAPSPGKPYAEVVADIAAGTRLEDIAAHLVEFEAKARTDELEDPGKHEGWMLKAEDEAEAAHRCFDIIEKFAQRQSQEHRDILRQAAQEVADAFLDTETTENLSKQSHRQQNSREFLSNGYRENLFSMLRIHAAMRLAGNESPQVSNWKDAAAIVLLLVGDKDFEILLARFGLRWKDKHHRTDYVQAAVLARAKVGTPLTNSDQRTVTALQKLNILPDDPDSDPVDALQVRRQRMKRKISDTTKPT